MPSQDSSSGFPSMSQANAAQPNLASMFGSLNSFSSFDVTTPPPCRFWQRRKEPANAGSEKLNPVAPKSLRLSSDSRWAPAALACDLSMFALRRSFRKAAGETIGAHQMRGFGRVAMRQSASIGCFPKTRMLILHPLGEGIHDSVPH
jgi:hypothetical protein